MSIETVHADWVKDQVFILKDHLDFPIVMTQPNGANGADLLPLSLIGCAVWDVQSILIKQRQPITAISVTADSEREDEAPWRFLKIHIHYTIRGRRLEEKQVKKAIELAETKYCSIYATLKAAIEIDSDFEILNQTE
ncbi:MAG TPA: OsmC family protein [Anaerolineaceae bacterium]